MIIAAISFGLAIVASGCSSTRVASTGQIMPATEASGPAECARSTVPPGNTSDGGKLGQLIPATVTGTTLCTYAVPRDSAAQSWPLTQQRGLSTPTAERVAIYLNALPVDHELSRTCAMSEVPAYTIVFSYADGGSATVQVNLACSTVERDGVIRSLTSGKELLNYWN